MVLVLLKTRHLWALIWRCPVESLNIEQAGSLTSLPVSLDYVFSSGLSVPKPGKPWENWDKLATPQTIDMDLGISTQMLSRYKDHLHVTLVTTYVYFLLAYTVRTWNLYHQYYFVYKILYRRYDISPIKF